MSIVPVADKRATEGMEDSRLGGSSSLIEVAWILVQQRWQDRSSNHNVGKSVGSSCAKSLGIARRSLLIVWCVACLINAGKRTHSQNRHNVSRGSECEMKL